MERRIQKLSALAASKANKPGRYSDGAGLWLQVTKAGTKSWLFRYMRYGKAREMGLGALHTISLSDAREKALQCRKLLQDGKDPIEEKRSTLQQARLDESKTLTFTECAEKYIEAHRSGWRNAKHITQWENTISTYATPIFGSLPVAGIDTTLVMKCLEEIWEKKPETASRLRGRIEAVLDWATAREYRKGENPARWRGHLNKLLPSRAKVAKVKHHKALPYSEIPAFMDKLRQQDGIAARAMEFLVLTATRTNETLGAQWSEIDMDAALWTIPAERMKAGREHRVPLSPRALDILRAMEELKQGDFIFPGRSFGKSLSNMACLMTLRRMKRTDLTAHGFRSTFRDWTAEVTSCPSEVAEMALAHTVSDKVEAAYRRGDLFKKREKLMKDWTAYCQLPAAKGETVVPMRRT